MTTSSETTTAEVADTPAFGPAVADALATAGARTGRHITGAVVFADDGDTDEIHVFGVINAAGLAELGGRVRRAWADYEDGWRAVVWRLAEEFDLVNLAGAIVIVYLVACLANILDLFHVPGMH